jgi:nitric oxide reductase NorD protein
MSKEDPKADNPSVSAEQQFEEHLNSLKSPSERQSLIQLTRDLARLSLDKSAVALEAGASVAGVSLRVAMEFLRAAPEAASILTAAELRSWAEIGRRLALGDVETAISFFTTGVKTMADLSPLLRQLVFQLTLRQMTLSSAIAYETFQQAPTIANALDDQTASAVVFGIAAEISRRSARHSAEFLNASPGVLSSLKQFATTPAVIEDALSLANDFASRAGGVATDAWNALPQALGSLTASAATRLLHSSKKFLERGGGIALQVLTSGSETLRLLPEVFDDWIKLLVAVADHGNASLIAFVRSSPRFVRSIARHGDRTHAAAVASRVIELTTEIARLDGEAALACFRASALALRNVSIEQFEQWVRQGLTAHHGDARARRSYFAIETRRSQEVLHTGGNGLPLEVVQHLLQLYVEGLTGKAIEIAPLTAVPIETRIGDGRTIHLPALVAEFNDDELDFQLYKVLAAHGAGQIEFGTYDVDTVPLRAAYSAVSEEHDRNAVEARDAFAVADEMLGVEAENIADVSPVVFETGPTDIDYRSVLNQFPIPYLARRIFGTLENARIDWQLRRMYRGLKRDLDVIREHVRRGRPRIIDLPATMVPFELLFQVTLCGGALEEARHFYGQIVSELESVAEEYLHRPNSSVADSLMATSRVYTLFKSVAPDESAAESEPEESASDEESQAGQELFRRERSDRSSQRQDVRELFNAWNNPDADGEPDEIDGAESWIESDSPEQTLEEGEVAYNYDEWDRELTDHRLGWCRVIEKIVRHGDRRFVDQTRERYKGVISSIRYQFQLMKPEDLTRVFNELDGEEFDLSAVVDYVIDRRAARAGSGHPSERLYTKRLRRRRDVAVSFLLDQSSSTARTIGRHPLQPYTHPGRRIIEIEKEGLVLMSEALEAVGDVYSINGFTSEGRRNVKFYVVKDFDEKYSNEVKQRIGGITYQNNTRLGAAIRHAAMKLKQQNSRTRLLIVLSDGRPYDHDYGDARYAREDTREALRQAKNAGIVPFCITIDRESESELRDLYGEVGYTIIDDVLSLPERLPGIYRRLTA